MLYREIRDMVALIYNQVYFLAMKTLTIKEFVKDSEGIIKRVENGERIVLTDGDVSAVLVPSDEYLYRLQNEEGP